MKLLDAISLAPPPTYPHSLVIPPMQKVHRQTAHNCDKQANLQFFTLKPSTQLISNNKKIDPLAKDLLKMSLECLNLKPTI